MYVKVVVAIDGEGVVKVCTVYASETGGRDNRAWKRFEALKKVYGGANVCIASRRIRAE